MLVLQVAGTPATVQSYKFYLFYLFKWQNNREEGREEGRQRERQTDRQNVPSTGSFPGCNRKLIEVSLWVAFRYGNLYLNPVCNNNALPANNIFKRFITCKEHGERMNKEKMAKM